MHRPTVGIIALVLLLLAVVARATGGDQDSAWQAGCFRISLLMGAIWLALPHLRGLHPLWLFGVVGAVLVALLMAAKHPAQIALLAGAALVLAFLRTATRSR